MIRNFAILLAFILLPTISYAEDSLLPDEMITSSIDSMNSQLGDQENKRRLEDDKDELYSIIDSTLSPYFQKQYAGRLVLNKHWTKQTLIKERDLQKDSINPW